MRTPAEDGDRWRSSAKALLFGLCIAGGFEWAFYGTTAPKAQWPQTLRERAVFASLRNLGLGTASMHTEGDHRGQVVFNLSTEVLSGDVECALQGRSPESDFERYTAILAVAIMASEMEARSPARRRVKELLVTAAHRLGISLNWTMGPGQIRLSTAEKLLDETFGPGRTGWADAVEVSLKRCSALALIDRIIRPSLEAPVRTDRSWRFWQVQETREDLPQDAAPAASLPDRCSRFRDSSPFPPQSDTPANPDPCIPVPLRDRPIPRVIAVNMRPFQLEQALLTYRGGEEPTLFNFTYAQLVSDVFTLLMQSRDNAEFVDAERGRGYNFQIEQRVVFQDVVPGEVQGEFFPYHDFDLETLKSILGYKIELIAMTGQLEPKSVTVALKAEREASIIARLPADMKGLPIVRRGLIGTDCNLPKMLVYIVPVGYPLQVTGDLCASP